MKLFWITDDFLPHLGGSRLLYYQTMKCFSPSELLVLTKRRPGWREFDEGEPIPIRRGSFKKFRSFGRLMDVPVYVEMLTLGAYWLVRSRADVIVCGELLPAGLAGRVLSLLSGKPYIVYVHGEEVGFYEKLRGEKRLAFSVLRGAHAVIACARAVHDRVLDHGVQRERLHLLTPGVAEDFLRARPRPEMIIDRYGMKGKRILLTVGRLIERKGHESVIRAMPELIERFNDLAYLIAGTGPEEKVLRSLACREGVADAVIFTGRLSREELVDCYAACDVFVMPHRELADGDTEGAGIVFLEAAAMGKPVVSGSGGGSADSVIDGETGFRVDTGNPGELAEKLGCLLDDEELAKRMGEAGRRMVMKDRRWEDRAEALRGICTQLLRCRSGGEGC